MTAFAVDGGGGGTGPVDESRLALADVATANVTAARHGLAPKLPADATRYLDGTGAYSVPTVGGSAPVVGGAVTGGTAGSALQVGPGGLLAQVGLARAGMINALNPPGGLTPAVGDGVTDDAPALQALLNAYPGRTVFLPATSANPESGTQTVYTSYYLGSVPAGNHAGVCLDVQGGSSVLCGDSTRTYLLVAPGLTAVRLSGGACRVESLALQGQEVWSGGNGTGWWEGRIPAGFYTRPDTGHLCVEADGFSGADGVQVASGNSVLRNVQIDGFGRTGINVNTAQIGTVEGERPTIADFQVRHVRGHGIHLNGGDANVFNIEAGSVTNNQFWGINNEAFLGGRVAGVHTDNNFYDSTPYPVVPFCPILSIARDAGHVVTLTFQGVYPDPATATFASPGAGTGVEIAASPDPTFLGRWHVASGAASGGDTVVTFTQTGTQGVGTTPGAAAGTVGTIATGVRVAAGTTTGSSPWITGLSSTAGIAVGMYVFGPNVPGASTYYGLPPRVTAVDAGAGTVLMDSWAANVSAGLTPGTGGTAGTAPMTFSSAFGAFNSLPAHDAFTSAVRAAGVVTLTFSGAYVAAAGHPVQAGHGVTITNASDPTFNGTFVVHEPPTVDGSGRTVVRYAQPRDAGGALLPDATATAGTARMAVPRDLWAAAGQKGGCFRSINGDTLWEGCYSEGGQDYDFATSALAIQPVKSTTIASGTVFSSHLSGVGALGFSQFPSMAAETDGGFGAEYRPGVKVSGPVSRKWKDVKKIFQASTGDTTTWDEFNIADQADPNCSWRLYQGSNGSGTKWREWLNFNGASYYASTAGPIYLNDFAGNGGSGVSIGDGSGAVNTLILGGYTKPTPIHDAAAANGSWFVTLDHADGAGNPSPAFKDATGVVTVLGAGGGGPGGAAPAGPTGAVQTNAGAGALGGSANLTYAAGCLTAAATTQADGSTLAGAGSLANYPYAVATTLGGGAGAAGGLVWYTSDNNATNPKAALWVEYGASGSSVVVGTSGTYTTGITAQAKFSPVGFNNFKQPAVPATAFPISNDVNDVQPNAVLTVQTASDTAGVGAVLKLAPTNSAGAGSLAGAGPLVVGRRSSATGAMLDFYTIGGGGYTWCATFGETGLLTLASALRTGTGATGSRPTLTSGQAGAQWFDTTLGKPIWWAGSGWVDAMGNTV